MGRESLLTLEERTVSDTYLTKTTPGRSLKSMSARDRLGILVFGGREGQESGTFCISDESLRA